MGRMLGMKTRRPENERFQSDTSSFGFAISLFCVLVDPIWPNKSLSFFYTRVKHIVYSQQRPIQPKEASIAHLYLDLCLNTFFCSFLLIENPSFQCFRDSYNPSFGLFPLFSCLYASLSVLYDSDALFLPL